MKVATAFYLILLFFTSLQIDAMTRDVPQAKVDSASSILVRHLNQKTLDEYAQDRDFQYDEAELNVNPSLWERFLRFLMNLFSEGYSRGSSGGKLKYLFLALGLGTIIFMAIKFAGMDLNLIIKGKSERVPLEYSETEENIHIIPFDEQIEKAVANKDYKLAVRLLYLQSLKKLSDAGRIRWEPDKTNAQYTSELKNEQQKEQFSHLTRKFEYAWYGGFTVDENFFAGMKTQFSNFNYR